MVDCLGCKSEPGLSCNFWLCCSQPLSWGGELELSVVDQSRHKPRRSRRCGWTRPIEQRACQPCFGFVVILIYNGLGLDWGLESADVQRTERCCSACGTKGRNSEHRTEQSGLGMGMFGKMKRNPLIGNGALLWGANSGCLVRNVLLNGVTSTHVVSRPRPA